MARGDSGRVVIELDPEIKANLHDALSQSGMTMKSWFLREAERFLAVSTSYPKRVAENQASKYGASPSSGKKR